MAVATNLPRELSSIVGRDAAIEEVALLVEEAPLVTLFGVGGAGKTRLALRVGHVLAERGGRLVQDGVWMVELAPTASSEQVWRAVAAALGVAVQRPHSLEAVLVDFVRTRNLVLVLDNCEHVVAIAAELTERLLTASPGLRVLATSREPLGSYGEITWPVPPLALPVGDDPKSVVDCAAGYLFLDRASAARRDFEMSAASALAVASICRRVDGIPLAIELAAAQVAALGPSDIALRLDNLLSAPAVGRRGLSMRQQSIEAAIDWSYQLLQASEQRLFEYLSVFADGFTLEAAEAIDDGSAAWIRLGGLVNKSLVQSELQADGQQRYRLLEPIRQFALSRIRHSGNLADARRRHALHLLSVAEAAAPELDGPKQLEAHRRLARERANMRDAMDYAIELCDSELGIRFASALSWWWTRPDSRVEGRARLAKLLELPVQPGQELARAKITCLLVVLAGMQGDMGDALDWLARARWAAHTLDDASIKSHILLAEAMLLQFQADIAGARAKSERGRALARSHGLHWQECRHLHNLAELALADADPILARQHVAESLSIARAAGDTWSEAMALNGLGDVLRSEADYTAAEQAYLSAVDLFNQLETAGAMPHQPWAGLGHNLGYIALARGSISRAIAYFVEAADAYQRFGPDWRGVAECVMGLGSVAVRCDQPALAARLFGAAEAALERLGSTFSPTNRTEYERVVQALRATLGSDVMHATWQAGRALDPRGALLIARELESVAKPARGVAGVADLTARELEVARLVARGLSNRQVAEELVITEKTAANHLQHVLDKLDLRSRSLLAARAAELGL